MGYRHIFDGTLEFATPHLFEAALDAFVPLDAGYVSFDKLEVRGLSVSMNLGATSSRTMYPLAMASVRALARFARSGEVFCRFETSDGELVRAAGRTDESGLPPRHRAWELHFAARTGDVNVLKQLLSEGVEPLRSSSPHLCATLHLAAASGKAEAVLAILKAGVPVDHLSETLGRARRPRTSLSFATSAEVVEVLIAAGAKFDAEIMSYGVSTGVEAVGLSLLAHGAPLPGARLEYLLAQVVHRGHVKLLSEFLKTAPDIARQLGEAVVIDALVRRADPALIDLVLEQLPANFLNERSRGAEKLLRYLKLNDAYERARGERPFITALRRPS